MPYLCAIWSGTCPSSAQSLPNISMQGTAAAPTHLDDKTPLLYLPLHGTGGGGSAGGGAATAQSRATAARLLQGLLASGKAIICFDIQSERRLVGIEVQVLSKETVVLSPWPTGLDSMAACCVSNLHRQLFSLMLGSHRLRSLIFSSSGVSASRCDAAAAGGRAAMSHTRRGGAVGGRPKAGGLDAQPRLSACR